MKQLNQDLVLSIVAMTPLRCQDEQHCPSPDVEFITCRRHRGAAAVSCKLYADNEKDDLDVNLHKETLPLTGGTHWKLYGKGLRSDPILKLITGFITFYYCLISMSDKSSLAS